MGHGNELVQWLRPLGVYSFAKGSYSLAELEALGAALDELDTLAQRWQRESIVMTAEEEGLARMESLFRHRALATDPENRRAAIAGFLQISGDGFTPAALSRCLAACGVACLAEETGKVNQVKISFPQTMGVPAEIQWMKVIIEDILPCQLDIFYYYRYCTWGETMAYGLTWGDLGKMTWKQWREYKE